VDYLQVISKKNEYRHRHMNQTMRK